MGKRRTKLKKAVTLARLTPGSPVDRRSTDLPVNAFVAAVDVDDPYERGAKITVLRSLRDDSLARMKARKYIDEAQYEAGRHWQNCYEITQIGGAKAFDFTREAVDGGSFRDNRDSDRYARAFNDLNRAAATLGMIEGVIVRDVLANCMFLNRVAAARGFTEEWAGRTFREALDKLSILYGFAMGYPQPPQDVAKRA